MLLGTLSLWNACFAILISLLSFLSKSLVRVRINFINPRYHRLLSRLLHCQLDHNLHIQLAQQMPSPSLHPRLLQHNPLLIPLNQPLVSQLLSLWQTDRSTFLESLLIKTFKKLFSCKFIKNAVIFFRHLVRKQSKNGWTDIAELQATELTELYTKSQSLLQRQKVLQESSAQADRQRSDFAMAQAAARQAFDTKLRGWLPNGR